MQIPFWRGRISMVIDTCSSVRWQQEDASGVCTRHVIELIKRGADTSLYPTRWPGTRGHPEHWWLTCKQKQWLDSTNQNRMLETSCSMRKCYHPLLILWSEFCCTWWHMTTNPPTDHTTTSSGAPELSSFHNINPLPTLGNVFLLHLQPQSPWVSATLSL